MGKARTGNRELAKAYGELENDLRNIRRLASLAHWLFHDLPPNFDLESQEEYAALLWAIEEMTVDVERRWDTGWAKAGGDQAGP